MPTPVKAVYDSAMSGHIKVLVTKAIKDEFGYRYTCEVTKARGPFKKGATIETRSLWLWSSIKPVGLAGLNYCGKPDLSELQREADKV